MPFELINGSRLDVLRFTDVNAVMRRIQCHNAFDRNVLGKYDPTTIAPAKQNLAGAGIVTNIEELLAAAIEISLHLLQQFSSNLIQTK
jgi:hypothetical protein